MAMTSGQGGHRAWMSYTNEVPSSHSLEYQPTNGTRKLMYKVGDKGVERHI